MAYLVTNIQVCPIAEAEEDVINSFYADLWNEVNKVHTRGQKGRGEEVR